MPARGITSTRELRDFARAGVDKSDATRAKLKELRDRLTQAMNEFARNIREGSRKLTDVKLADLDGLPADFIARHPADASGAVTLTTSAVDARPVLMYAKSERAAAPHAGGDLQRGRSRKRRRARSDPAGARRDRRRFSATGTGLPTTRRCAMAGDEKTVSAFIDRVVDAARPRAARELAELTRRKQQDVPGSALEPWDRLYYSELVRRSNYDFDSQVRAPVLPVRPGARGRAARDQHDLRSSPIEQVTDVPVWHPSVRVYEMRDGDIGWWVGCISICTRARTRPRAAPRRSRSAPDAKGRMIPEVVLAASLPGNQPAIPA